MKRSPFVTTLLLVSLLVMPLATGCTATAGGGNATANAVQALVSTTRTAVLLMTAAGVAYDAGAFGVPGSPGAEETWRKIAAESLRMNTALTSWSDAIRANKDASSYSSVVMQALAIIGALLPARTRAELPNVTASPLTLSADIARLQTPDAFRQWSPVFVGGAR